jgi:hypothetical protein
MSESEMMSLDDELTRIDFWRVERDIEKMVDQYMQHGWRDGRPHYMVPVIAPPASYTMTTVAPHIPAVRTKILHIEVRVPSVLNERTARLLAYMQIREQVYEENPLEEE